MDKSVLVILLTVLIAACSSTSKSSISPCGEISNVRSNHPIVGWVELSFEISEAGTTENIKVIASSPVGYFEEEAIKALSSWKYKPKIVDGNPIRQLDLWVKLDFKLEDDEN
ncbi:energy transducer TonB [Alteromonas ponticola]|uniref:Energy transducer TonB n=1 Tax=Alteromonas aquimaris TaxID=2998417 RepID=A0ABT3P8A1_9ALTE|nr:energy transducer TonB [Alteromonas aquimaris]MCW8108974.1 energy transducer TonB [Alteromonas aquimaris]